MFKEIKKEIKWGSGQLELSTGKIARQASGAVMVKMGDTVVLCTSVTAARAKDDMNFFPLTVHYQEKAYAAGKIPGGFFKSEGKPSEKEVLTSRLIDRPIRPLFPNGFFNDTQVICTVLSYDPLYNPDILALVGASAALSISGVPYLDVVAASRVGLVDGEFVLNPSSIELENSSLDLVVAGTKSSVMMVESEAEFLSEKQMLDAVKFGHKEFQPVIKLINELTKEVNNPKWKFEAFYPEILKKKIASHAKDDIVKAFKIKTKQERYDQLDKIKCDVIDEFAGEEKYSEVQVEAALSEVKSDILRKQTLDSKKRIDSRKKDDIRPIECETSLLPGTHGSSLFTRGETQALVTTTLGTGQDEQMIDSLEKEYKERFLLNYLFPPYSVGETTPLRAAGRREIGHGKLAWRALSHALPSKEEFPYTIRVVSEITESNGSSSMATVCGGSMAMMDAGIPLKAAIAGIAMGLIKTDNDFMVLSDIIADEDYLGDMDFKVAGSHDAVTALQMDIKVEGITFDIMEKALEQARLGRIHILDKMNKAIKENGNISENAPMIESFTINKDKIRDVIGAGGKVIREICDTTGAKIEISDDGVVSISAIGRDKLEAAKKEVQDITMEPKIGQVFEEATVVKILDAGAFINYARSRDGFVHISEIANERIESVSSALKEGQKVKVKLIGFERGKAKLTIKNADSSIEVKEHSPEDRGDRGDRANKSDDNRDRGHRSNKREGHSARRRSVNKQGPRVSDKREGESKEEKVTERKYFS